MSAGKYKKWKYTNIYKSAKIGDGTSIGSYTEIGKNVEIGTGCKIQAFVFIPEGIEIKDNVFIGPGTVFCNDKYPIVNNKAFEPENTLVRSWASIGANCTILPGVTIGYNALIGAGSVVTKDVPMGETWCGNPAKKVKSDKIKEGFCPLGLAECIHCGRCDK